MAFAQLLADTGNAAQAEPILQQLNSQSPTSVPVLDLLFNVQIAQKHFADAAVTATKVINLSPGRDWATTWRARQRKTYKRRRRRVSIMSRRCSTRLWLPSH